MGEPLNVLEVQMQVAKLGGWEHVVFVANKTVLLSAHTPRVYAYRVTDEFEYRNTLRNVASGAVKVVAVEPRDMGFVKIPLKGGVL